MVNLKGMTHRLSLTSPGCGSAAFVSTWRGGVDRRAAVAWLETARGGRQVGKRAEWAAQAGRPTGPVRGFRAGRGRRV
jgi:hypothetical protein